MADILKMVKFGADGLIPAVTQDIRTDEVLMLAYMNEESLKKTVETGKAHYFSRSRGKLWLKGETSGHFQKVRSISIDCDGDTLLLKVEQTGAACHTGHHSCFFTRLEPWEMRAAGESKPADGAPEEGATGESTPEDGISEGVPGEKGADSAKVLQEVFEVISDRKVHPKEGSYTNYLFNKGLDKILKKIGEEACEVVIAAKNGPVEEIKPELADLFYHIMVLLAEKKMTLQDVYSELEKRK